MIDYRIWLGLVLGYFFSAFVAHYFIGRTVDRLWKSIGWTGDVTHREYNIRPGAWIPPMTGFLERILYTTSLQMGHGEFIGVWLAIKVASQWNRWSEEGNRTRFQIFLIGSALSVLYGSVGFKIINWITWSEWLDAISAVASVLLMTEILRWWASKHDEKTEPRKH